jgi:hypothetical protein
MAIYDYDANIVSEQLTPPILRRDKFLAFLNVLCNPIKNIWINVFQDYKEGGSYSPYSSIVTYDFGNKVIATDKSIYQCIVTTSLNVKPSSTTNWVKVNDLFIGSNERVKYSAQKILFEYALNNFFITSGIYITNNFVTASNNFVMDDESENSSNMPLDSYYQEDFMDDTATYNTAIYDYTIFLPIAFHTSLGANANGIIKSFADKYNLAGMQYNIDTY